MQIDYHEMHKNVFHFRFICIYPAYIDAKKTVQEGRKVPKEHCIENPTYLEIKDVLLAANMNLVIENKIYPRERSKVCDLILVVSNNDYLSRFYFMNSRKRSTVDAFDYN